MHAEGNAATDREHFGAPFPTRPRAVWCVARWLFNLFRVPSLFFSGFSPLLVSGRPVCGSAWFGSRRGRALRATVPHFRAGFPPSVDQRSGATHPQSIPRRRGHGGSTRAGKVACQSRRDFGAGSAVSGSVHRERITVAQAYTKCRITCKRAQMCAAVNMMTHSSARACVNFPVGASNDCCKTI